MVATAELSYAALHFGAQILRAQVSPWWRQRHLSYAALLFGAQILLAQVSPCWRRRRLATLLCTLALESCMHKCRLGGDGGAKLRCFALRCSNPACAGVALVATAALQLRCFALRCSNPACAGVALMATAAFSYAAFALRCANPECAGVALAATAASLRCFCTSVLKSCMRRRRLGGDGGVSTLLLHFGAHILHAQVSPGWRRPRTTPSGLG